MSRRYFSDKERPPKPRINEEIDAQVWAAIDAEIGSRIDNGSFGMAFPKGCPDGKGPTGTNETAFYNAAYGHIPDIHVSAIYDVPPTLAILDFIEFCY